MYIPFWALFGGHRAVGPLFLAFNIRRPKLYGKTAQIRMKFSPEVALSKPVLMTPTKPVSDHGARRNRRFSGDSMHVRYLTFGTNGLR